MTTNHLNPRGSCYRCLKKPTACYRASYAPAARLEFPLSVRHLPLVLRGCPGVCDLAKNMGTLIAARWEGKMLHQAAFLRWIIHNENYGTFGFGVYRFSLCLVGDAYQLMDVAVHDCFFP